MREGSITVRDGRTVAYAEFGDPAGTPVLLCHGSAESRLVEIDAEWTGSHGVRVLTPDRPGFGGSDPLPGRTLAGWAEDAADLLDALDLARVAVVGWSGGGPHALAAAQGLGPRVTELALVSSFAPFKLVPGAYKAMAPDLRLLADLAPTDPKGTADLVAAVAEAWVADPDSFGLGGESVDADEAVLAHPEWGPNVQAQIREGLKRTDGIAWDAAALYGEWGFPAEAVRQPADIWHGTLDAVTPFLNGAWLARTLPDATLHEVAGGHFILYSHWHEIITTLLDHRR